MPATPSDSTITPAIQPPTRRGIFGRGAMLGALVALPAAAYATTSNSHVADLWARRETVLAELDRYGHTDEQLDALSDRLADIEDLIMEVPVTSAGVAVRRLQLAAYDARWGERFDARRSVEETVGEVIAWLETLS